MPWSLSFDLSGNAQGKYSMACYGVLPLSFLGTLLWKLQCIPWSLITLLWKLQCMSWSLSLELPGPIVIKTIVHAMEYFPWASWGRCYKTAVHVMESFPWASSERFYENCSACHGVFPLNFLRTLLWKLQCMLWSLPLSFLGTLLWKLQCMSWSISLELPGNIVMKTTVYSLESFPWASRERSYEKCTACHGVFPLSFLGTLLWKLQCMSWNLSLELPGNIVMKTAVHVIESFPWAFWEHCDENCSVCHWVFPLSFLETVFWKLQCMSWSLSLELPGNIVMKTAVHVIESFPWASWEHFYENCSACHRVFSMIFLGTLLWKLQCMQCREWRFTLDLPGNLLWDLQCLWWSVSLEFPGNIVMTTAVHIMESFLWTFWKHCYENCSACQWDLPLSFLGTLLWKLQCML